MKLRIAFDLDETLGIPLIENDTIVGFRWRDGAVGLLNQLRNHTLCLWTVSTRSYLNKVLSYGLAEFFEETYSWDELPVTWKDVRKLRVDYLIDDSPHHQEAALKQGLEHRYIIVSAYGSIEDSSDPLGWVHKVEEILLRK